MARLLVRGANPLVSVQDAGRRGAMRYGVSQSGPMDWVRFAHAVALAGDDGARAAFEIGVAGAAFAAEGAFTVAVTGPGFGARIDGAATREVALPARISLADGDRLTIVPGRTGMWAYLAVPGIDLGEPVLGSHATNARTGLGARALEAFAVAPAGPPGEPLEAQDVALFDGPIGLLPGPQHHLFGEEARAAFTGGPYRLTGEVDRMGYKLEGAPLAAHTHDIISDGIVEGAIQVPGNRQPIVLCADRAPTGGYPKIAVVASADRPRLTQARPGSEIAFRWLDLDEAHRRRRTVLARLAEPPRPRVRTRFEPEFLASRNLVSGVVAAGRAGPDPAEE